MREIVTYSEAAPASRPPTIHWPDRLIREAVYRRLHEHHAPTMRFLTDLGIPSPEAFSTAAKLRPDYAPIQFYLGQSYFLADEPARAARHYRRALEIDPSSPSALVGLAQVALARDDPDTARGVEAFLNGTAS